MQGLDSSFDAIFFVTYHGSMSSQRAAVPHLQPAGDRRGVAQRHRGRRVRHQRAGGARPRRADRADHRRRRHRPRRPHGSRPGVHAAVVKTAVSRFAADSLHPTQACDADPRAGRGRDPVAGRRRAAGDRAAGHPCRSTFRNADLADMATWIIGVERGPGTHGDHDRRRPDRAVPRVHQHRACSPATSRSSRSTGGDGRMPGRRRVSDDSQSGFDGSSAVCHSIDARGSSSLTLCR